MKSMRRVYWMAFMTVLAVSLSGCGGLQKQLVDANARIKELNEQIGKFSEAMEKSADKIDPLAIKEIFRKGNDLAKMNQELQRLVETGGPRSGNLNLAVDRLRMEIVGYKGSIHVVGWIDKEEDGKRFVNVAFPDKDVHLTLPKEIPITWLRQRVCREVAIRTNPPQPDNVVCNDVPADWVGPGGATSNQR